MLENYADIIEEIKNDGQMQAFWKKYQKDFGYAQDISFDDACNSVMQIMDLISAR